MTRRLIALLLLLLLLIPAASAGTIIDETVSEWVDTSGNGTVFGGASPSYIQNAYGGDLVFSDITDFPYLSYIVIEIPALNYVNDEHSRTAFGWWADSKELMDAGRHDFTYEFLGVSHPGVVYVERPTDLLGRVTKTKFTIFLNDWDIADSTGTQRVPLPFHTYYGAWCSAGSGSSEVQLLLGNYRPGYRYVTYTYASGIPWENHLTVTESTAPSGYEITLARTVNNIPYTSTLEALSGETIVHTSTRHGTEERLWYPKSGIDTITITSPSGAIYTYTVDSTPPEIAPTLYGDVLDVLTGEPISGATITAAQPSIGRTVTATSGATGAYSTAGSSTQLLADEPVTISASAAGYTNTSLSFSATPRYTSWYVPILMVPAEPDIPTEPDKTALYGYVVTQGNQQPIQGATVSIEGIGSTTTTSTGSYIFANITPGSYTITASASQHDTLTESVTAAATLTQHNLALAGHHSLTVTVKDADTLKILTNATTISLSDGQEANDRNPTTFAVDYGQYTVTAAAGGYYPGSQYAYIDKTGDTSIVLLLTAKPEPVPPPEMPNYPPHNVKFTIQTLLGTPIPGVTVTAQGIQQTPSTNILEALLGLNMTSTPINSELMSGTTDTNGEINFMMIEAVKYRIQLYKPDVVNQTLEIYPKEDTYPIIISTAGGPLLPDAGDALRDIHINVTTSTGGDTGHIHIDYNDTTRKTTSLTIQVTQQNTTDTSAPEDVIASHTVANDANVTHTFDLSVYKGQSFFVRLEAEHPDFGTVHRDYAVAFKGVRVPLGPLPDGLYIYVAGFGLMLLGGIFGATSATRGVVVIAFAGWLFYAFGWLDDLGLIAPVSLGLVSTIAVMGVIVTRYREEGYT